MSNKTNQGNEEIKNNEDKNLQKLREEFDKKRFQNENHPKTSYGNKHLINQKKNIYSQSCKKTPKRYNKALSANKFNHKNNENKVTLNEQISYNFCKNHPGFLYYKEIMASINNNKLNKIRTLTGKPMKKMKLEYVHINISDKNLNNNKFKENQKFPKINYGYNNKKNINEKISIYNNYLNDKNNPYSIFWANKILNQSDYRIDIKGMTLGVPKLGSVNNREDFFLKVLNKSNTKKNLEKSNKNLFKKFNNKLNIKGHYNNNYIGIINQKNSQKEIITKEIFDINKKCDKIETNKKEMKNIVNDEKNKGKILEDYNNKNKKEDNGDEYEEESLDEEVQKQFYKNQKNFFKARKDIIEEPEFLEEDNDIN